MTILSVRKGVRNLYKVGDAVEYASNGVCVISAVEKHDFSGEDVEYYVLKPINDERNRFYVPTEKCPLHDKLRDVCSRDEAERLIGIMSQSEPVWIDDDTERREEYRKIIDSGDREELIRLIKALYLHRQKLSTQNRHLHISDERTLLEAENMLYDELSYALDIPRSEVIPYIESHI